MTWFDSCLWRPILAIAYYYMFIGVNCHIKVKKPSVYFIIKNNFDRKYERLLLNDPMKFTKWMF